MSDPTIIISDSEETVILPLDELPAALVEEQDRFDGRDYNDQEQWR